MVEPWYRNHYRCVRCKTTWTDEWSSMCDDRCPSCCIEMTPHFSEEFGKTGFLVETPEPKIVPPGMHPGVVQVTIRVESAEIVS